MVATENRIVKIEKVKRNNWMGITSYPKTYETIVPTLGRGGLYKTGLSPKEETEYEIAMSLPPGTLAPRSNFWADIEIRFVKDKAELNLTNTLDQLKLKFALANKRVAPSKAEMTPYTEYVIVDEEKDAQLENVKINYKRKAYAKFGGMSHDEMRGILKLYGKKKPEATSNEVVENTLAKLLEQDPKKFIELVEDPHLSYKVLIEDALVYGVLRKNGTHYVYQNDPIGHDLEAAIFYLQDAKNQAILATIKKAIKAAQK